MSDKTREVRPGLFVANESTSVFAPMTAPAGAPAPAPLEEESAVAHCDGCDSDGILPSQITFDERHDPLVVGGCGHRITNPTAERLRARVAELSRALDAARADGASTSSNPWKDAIIDATVVDWVYTAEHETNPRKAINDLCVQAARIALDPAVSLEAKGLYDRIEAAEARAAQAEQHLAMIEPHTMQGITDCSTPLFVRVQNMAELLTKQEARAARYREALEWIRDRPIVMDASSAAYEMGKRADAALKEPA